MINDMTRQDFLSVTTEARNKIIERLVTKYDVQTAADSARDKILTNVNAMHLENQSLMRQLNAHNDQIWRKVTMLETEILNTRQDLKDLGEKIDRLLPD